ncbi:hypothetical protein CWC05_22815, partial [Pseudoalteromonas ruthenica]
GVIEHIEQLGCEVYIDSVDITDLTAVTALIHDIDNVNTPLKGIIHSAAVLDDDNLAQLTPERFKKVLEPKALGAVNLH